jgi:hypothetical protein
MPIHGLLYGEKEPNHFDPIRLLDHKTNLSKQSFGHGAVLQ